MSEEKREDLKIDWKPFLLVVTASIVIGLLWMIAKCVLVGV